MDANQKQQVAILKEKLKNNPSSPKAVKWKALIAQTEKGVVTEQKPMKSYLTPKAREVNRNIIRGCDDHEIQVRRDYLKTCLYPDSHSHRMPDELTQPTNLYRSIREFNLMCKLDGTVNSGRFSFAVTPKLGSVSSTSQYQCGIIDSSNGWPEDVTAPDAYVTNSLGSDPRVDPMAAQLTTAPLDFYKASNVIGSYTAAASLNVLRNWNPWPSDPNTRVSGKLSITPVGIGNSFTAGAYTVEPNNTGNWAFTVSDGVYTFSPIMTIQGSWNAASAPTSLTYRVGLMEIAEVPGGYTVLSTWFISRSGITSSGIWASANTNPYYTHAGDLWNTGQGELFDVRVNLRLRSKFLYIPVFSFVQSGATTTANNVDYGFSLTATSDPVIPSITNSGTIIKMRPVACSALVTCTLPPINAGGNIVAYSASSSDIDNYYYAVSGPLGELQLWENLARLNKGKQIHDGNFLNGAYVWTQPWDKNDTLLRTPLETLNYGYQGIIVSGQLNPSVALSGMVNAGRIRVCIIYEYVTDNRLFDPQPCLGSNADLDWVLAYLGQQQHATENDNHMRKLLEILQRSTKFIRASVPYVITGMEALTGLTSLLV